ncbi:MAG TPA: adenylate/guanylate cyclase domain-containing protein [Stellaceae bacterium]|nr:adenylate/guanylate cyclase domain-containing protein [Stellaceae bacterium]
MASEPVQRKLAAILAADVVGYSRLTGADEDLTLARLRALRSDLIDPTISVHHGRVVKRTGDGALVEFRSAVDAVRCAIEVQRNMVERNAGLPSERRIEFRIGVHLGDVVEESDGDLMGDGVNIAARLEGIADAGGICISEDTWRQVRDKIGETFTDLGERELKNIARPMRAYRVEFKAPAPATRESQALPLPDRPSIAVLPFQNMSGDPEQEYFADGIVEDIITALSRFRQLFVIARNSSFTYKGRAVDVKQVGTELGVRYVLEGSVRKAAGRVRITGQLIDTASGTHLWGDRIDGALEDIFDLQDQVTTSVVGAIAPKMELAEIERAKRKPTENLGAYDYYLRGAASFHLMTRAGLDAALQSFYRAIELDPEFASAYGMAAWSFVWRRANGWTADRAKEVAEAERLARRAVEFGKDDAIALSRAGHTMAFICGDLPTGAAFCDRALQANPNLATAWFLSGAVRVWIGEPEVAIEQVMRAMRMSPFDPLLYLMQTITAFAHFFAGRYGEASLWAEKALRDDPNWLSALWVTAASQALDGRLDTARQTMARARQIDPALRISTLQAAYPIRRPEDFAKWADGLRQAGMPEA